MSVVAVGLGLGLLNGTMFLGECAAYGTWWSDGQPVGLYENAAGERPQLKPGARLNGLLYSISINAMGFRGPDPAPQKPANALRVWCVGGSTTFDIFARDDAHTWPALLQDRLQQALPDRTVEVLNAGIPGEIIQGSATDIQNLAGSFEPDIVVIYHGPNDMRQVFGGPGAGSGGGPGAGGQGAGGPGAGGGPGGQSVGPDGQPIGPSGGAGMGMSLSEDLAAFRVLGRLLQSSEYLKVDRPDRSLGGEPMKQIRSRMEDLIRRSIGRGAAPVLATHALRAAPDATGDVARRDVAETTMMLQMSAESSIQAFGLYNQMVTRLAKERGYVLADVRSVVPPDAELWGDATHFRAGGSELAAEEIARAILASDLTR